MKKQRTQFFKDFFELYRNKVGLVSNPYLQRKYKLTFCKVDEIIKTLDLMIPNFKIKFHRRYKKGKFFVVL